MFFMILKILFFLAIFGLVWRVAKFFKLHWLLKGFSKIVSIKDIVALPRNVMLLVAENKSKQASTQPVSKISEAEPNSGIQSLQQSVDNIAATKQEPTKATQDEGAK
ncbi:hypothetical protein WK78_26580 [Burkholderia cepacia]|uniref:hypothetical protein n=1 Tax=Burkholderia cepacia TaxID=292 RepID=UPI000754530A|nr:hypothetical protein [Burkholderia cepacia]KVV20878.1 hypothetical protein WK78_26580 [Burkholderia cepacia]